MITAEIVVDHDGLTITPLLNLGYNEEEKRDIDFDTKINYKTAEKHFNALLQQAEEILSSMESDG